MPTLNKDNGKKGTKVNKEELIGPKTEDQSKEFIDRDKDDLPDTIDRHSYKFDGFTDEFFDRQLFKESKFDPEATSEAGAMGIAQFMPDTIEDMKRNRLVDEDFDPYDEDQARAAQRKYMGWLSERPYLAKGSDEVQAAKFVMAYNWGVGNAKKFLTQQRENNVDIYDSTDWVHNIPKNKKTDRYETKEYVQKIMNINQDPLSQDGFEEDLFNKLNEKKNPMKFTDDEDNPMDDLGK